ncbi:NAD(P)/FAD-dependent oxidoreductase [Glaciibacter psychrotolerans]|uniref:Thioredoxin reductase n=1 Tax=Glaciibacter psychrotolerans TaxID=670054 RepID=A0A7Z0EDC4_9MICO|nr:NAD(P)/FAD-dependent oxidoreductase [Leifsonia psychrotolerans]NYJ19557.1 thioredoxin reductase [Leifsonia psychrotolerans]
MTDQYDVVIIGAGPAGLAAGLSLVRARRRTLMIDSNRPRNAATLRSHGFITRDGVSPLELRKIGRGEFEGYPAAQFHTALALSVTATNVDEISGDLSFHESRFRVVTRGLRGEASRDVSARTVLIATGLLETLPALPSIRAWYGTNVHSCIDCDGYEKADAALALIGESDDLAERALLISQWTSDLIVFTNAVGTVTAADEAALLRRGIRVDRRPIADVVGERGAMTGVLLADGEVIAREGGFVRPGWAPAIDYLDASVLGQLERDRDGLVVVDDQGRTSIAGLYAAGDSTPPGAEQLMVAAGLGARAAAAINRDLIGPL